jgi:hypothetical protein
VKSAVVWLRCHDIADLLAATLPAVGTTTTYLRLWQKTLCLAADSPATARRSTVIQLAALDPRLRGSVHLTDVHAPWLVHLAQEQVWAWPPPAQASPTSRTSATRCAGSRCSCAPSGPTRAGPPAASAAPVSWPTWSGWASVSATALPSSG